MDETATANYYEDQIVKGKPPRIWIHTHPGDSAEPSMVDESQLSQYFATSNYIIMFILAHNGEVYCRLRVQHHKNDQHIFADQLLRVSVDWTSVKKINPEVWEREFKRNIKEEDIFEDQEDVEDEEEDDIKNYARNIEERMLRHRSFYRNGHIIESKKSLWNPDFAEIRNVVEKLLCAHETKDKENYERTYTEYEGLEPMHKEACLTLLDKMSNSEFSDINSEGLE